MRYSIELFTEQYEEDWDALVFGSPVGTFLHSRSFLSYHKDRFIDQSLVVVDKKTDTLVGVFPCALDESRKVASSHPGSTYGGIVTRSEMNPELVEFFLNGIINHMRSIKVRELIYKVTPFIYRLDYTHLDEYFIWRAKGINYRNDLCNIIDLNKPFKFSRRRQRSLKKAEKLNLKYYKDCEFTQDIWTMLEKNLAKHNVKPVHSLAEIKVLKDKFQDSILLHLATDSDGQPLCGVVAFHMPNVIHSQYIFSTDDGRKCGALDFLFYKLIELATEHGCSYFSFGASSEQHGQILNHGLFAFKSEFGSQGVLNRSYKFEIT